MNAELNVHNDAQDRDAQSRVSILLSTYNGEKYLREQVESIQKQTYTNWHLFIRDDGSRDATPYIIAELAENDERITWINPHERENLGVVGSFQALLAHATADFYLFSDQDDYWLEDKVATQVSRALAHAAECGRRGVVEPYMNYMDPVVVDAQLNTLTPSMIRSQSGHANTTLVEELTENTVTGGVSLINDALAQLWLGGGASSSADASAIMMHDWFLALLATAHGTLEFIDQQGELYRQHEANVLGARTFSKRVAQLSRPDLLVRKYWTLIHRSQKQAALVLENRYGGEELTEEKRELIRAFVTIENLPWRERARVLKRYNLRKNKRLMTLAFRVLLITGWGKRW
ncbi:glycosyltransferase family 2 protein [Alloscardovia macacae]|uniref:Glycosyltransferase group 2 family protein n=1 Tax=Alloscardovia macacae TaxID=1160091 RepID=A0A261F640_9BIFI|nr:glycosyltransferase family 2 protein [Alloscardovia macacae]OZG54602.1 glycosyltransferase group 2 family protein [Alloscardovia macacae]